MRLYKILKYLNKIIIRLKAIKYKKNFFYYLFFFTIFKVILLGFFFFIFKPILRFYLLAYIIKLCYNFNIKFTILLKF